MPRQYKRDRRGRFASRGAVSRHSVRTVNGVRIATRTRYSPVSFGKTRNGRRFVSPVPMKYTQTTLSRRSQLAGQIRVRQSLGGKPVVEQIRLNPRFRGKGLATQALGQAEGHYRKPLSYNSKRIAGLSGHAKQAAIRNAKAEARFKAKYDRNLKKFQKKRGK